MRDGLACLKSPEQEGENLGLTGCAFDPTIQPLWALYAKSFAAGRALGAAYIAVCNIGWQHVPFLSSDISFTQPDIALTLNGNAQGFIADKTAALLKADGIENVLIERGEIMALMALLGPLR